MCKSSTDKENSAASTLDSAYEARAQLNAVRGLLLAADGQIPIDAFDLAMLLQPIAAMLDRIVASAPQEKTAHA